MQTTEIKLEETETNVYILKKAAKAKGIPNAKVVCLRLLTLEMLKDELPPGKLVYHKFDEDDNLCFLHETGIAAKIEGKQPSPDRHAIKIWENYKQRNNIK